VRVDEVEALHSTKTMMKEKQANQLQNEVKKI